MFDLQVLVGALLLHFNILVELAVRGAEVVISLHSGGSECATCPVLCQVESAAVCARLHSQAFPRCHFNARTRSERRVLFSNRTNQCATSRSGCVLNTP